MTPGSTVGPKRRVGGHAHGQPRDAVGAGETIDAMERRGPAILGHADDEGAPGEIVQSTAVSRAITARVGTAVSSAATIAAASGPPPITESDGGVHPRDADTTIFRVGR